MPGNRIAPNGQVTLRNTKAKDSPSVETAVLPTGGINKSTVLSLQVADLNVEVTAKYERLRPQWSKISNRLETLIKDIPPRAPASAIDAVKSLRKQGVNIPFPKPQPSKDTNYKFEFKAPKHILVDGALPWGLSLKDDNVVKITAIMPEDLLQEKDYLNYRALHKAAFFVACIAAAIKTDAGSDFSLSFTWLYDVDLLPILEVVPAEKGFSKFSFQIAVGFPSVSIPVTKTLPTKCCLRQGATGEAGSSDNPTPFYNSCVRYAASIEAFAKNIQLTRSPSFDEACRIGQIWLRQRGFSSSTRSGGFGFREWALACALFLRGGGHRGHPLFSKQYSSLQFFKAMLQIISGRDFRDPMVVNGEKFDIPNSELPILFDADTGVNILYKMTPWSYQSLRHYAQVSLAAINARNQNNFDSLFVQDATTPALQYDEGFTIAIPAHTFSTIAEQRELLFRLHSTFMRGLGDRVSLVNFELPQQRGWRLKQEPTLDDILELQVGLLTNPDNVARLVDHGPSADEPEEAADFRKFWREKAELRRFRDGSISESLVWTPGIPVTLQIISHLVMTHFELLPSSIKTNSSDLGPTVLRNDSSLSSKDAFRTINSTFQTLTSMLHSLEGLPLPIRAISPVDPGLRSSSVGHPLLPSSARPINFVIQFESSNRWPDSLPAIQRTKIAFLLKVAELLTASDKNLTTRVGLENTDSATTGYFNTSFLDIIYAASTPGMSPICFRARIHHDRDAHLLQTTLSDKSLHGSVRDSLTTALTAYKRSFIAEGVHTTAIRNLCTRFPPLSGTIRLLKKWVSSHLLLEHVSEEVLEILSAKVFLQPSPWSTPGSSTTAFLRCLHLLSRWDWASTPLVVDLSLSQDLTTAQVSEIETRFQAWRKLDPSMNNVVWFVATNLDTTGTVWTQGGRPARVVATRLRALARASVGVIETKGTNMADSDWLGLFISALSDFDFQIHIKPSVLKSYQPKSKSKAVSGKIKGGSEFKNLQIHDSLDVDSIGYDPVALFLQDLNHAFGQAALFFFDTHGGSVVAGLWRPSVLGRKEWRVRLGWSSIPVLAEKGEEQGEAKDVCVVNKKGILAEIARLGEGLIKEITVKE